MSISFGGKTIVKPGAYSIVTREDASPVSYGSSKVLAFIATADDVDGTSEIDKDKVLWFNNYSDAKTKLIKGKLLNHLAIAWSPTKESGASGADLIAVVVATDPTITGYIGALKLLKKENVQAIIPLTTSVPIQAAVKEHIEEVSDVKGRKERFAFLGTQKLSEIVSAMGSGAEATATVGSGAITEITVTSEGSGYLVPPIVIISGDGSGAVAEAIVTNGAITSIVVVEGGSGYTEATISFEYSDNRSEEEKIADEIESRTAIVGSDRVVICAGGIKKYIEGSLITTDGAGLSAAVAGMWAGKTTPVDPITFDELDIYDLEYEIEDVDDILEAHAVIVEKVYGESRRSKFRIVNAQASTGKDLAVETTIDEMNKILRREMEDMFVGRVTGDPKTVDTSKYNKFISLLNGFVDAGWLVQSIDPNTGEELPPYKDVVMVKEGKSTKFTWWGKVLEPDNYILIDSHIAVSN